MSRMGVMKKSVSKKKVWQVIVGVLLSLTVTRIVGMMIQLLNMNYYTKHLLAEAIFLFAVIGIAVWNDQFQTLRFTLQGFGEGLKTGWVFLLASVSVVMFFLDGFLEETVTIGGVEIAELLCTFLLVGIAEELMCRGIIQNSLHAYFGEDSVSAVRKGILASGLIFGSIHLTNIFSSGEIVGPLVQAIVNVPNGMLYATVYYRSGKNLWVCIVLHSLMDIAGAINSGVLAGKTLEDQIAEYSISQAWIAIIIIGIVLLETRTKKLMPLVEYLDEIGRG